MASHHPRRMGNPWTITHFGGPKEKKRKKYFGGGMHCGSACVGRRLSWGHQCGARFRGVCNGLTVSTNVCVQGASAEGRGEAVLVGDMVEGPDVTVGYAGEASRYWRLMVLPVHGGTNRP